DTCSGDWRGNCRKTAGRRAACGSLRHPGRYPIWQGSMTDTNDTNDRRLGAAPGSGRTLSVPRTIVEKSRVKQNFSHGRTKTVVVETRRKRPCGPGGREGEHQVETKQQQFHAQPRVAQPAEKPKAEEPPQPRSGVVLRTLTSEEKEARDRALADA